MSEHGDGKFGVTLNEGHTPLAVDEPVFVFRAHDALMGDVLRAYIELCTVVGATPEHIAAIEGHLEAVLVWQANNECRIPN